MNHIPGAKVLLVDDEPANLLALEAVLEELGAALVRADSGPQALRLAQDSDFAAILLDVHMPGMDGFEVARLIRSRPRSRTTPILFVTASDSADLSIEQAYALGAVDFLTKPLVPAVLKGKVSFFIELHRSREELRAAERQAVNERAFLAAVLEAVEDGIVACDAQGTLTLFNRATRDLHGLPQQPLPPEQWSRHYDLYAADGTTPLPMEQVPLQRALAGEQVRGAEMVVAPRSGTRRTLLASGQSLYDEAGGKLGAVVSMHDVTAQREAAAAREAAVREQARRQEAEAAAELLRASEERYRTLFETMDEGFCVIEVLFDAQDRAVDYRFLEANPAFERHSGLANAVGRTAREMVPDLDRSWFEAYGKVAVSGEPAHFVNEARALGRWFEVSATRVGTPQDRRVAVLFNDITVRVRAEEDLRRLAAELAESDRRKTEFLATLAHELRNPLAPLRNGLQVMRLAQHDAATQQKTRDMMDRQVAHMVRLIDDLLDVARITSGKVDLRRERVPLRGVVDSAVETCLSLMEAAGHHLQVDLPDAPLLLEADPTRLAQVLGNLLNNAAKYTPAGGRITLAAREEHGQVVISVADSGIGIPGESLQNVFQMFTQVGRHLARSQGGLGIGLSLVRGLVELHGGTVTAASPGTGLGSTFSVRLPLADAGAGQAIAAAPQPGAQAAGFGFRVLVVDDNQDAAESLAMILEMGGHQVRVAHDGDQAVIVAQAFRPEIAFLDIGMPGKNGYQVARELRQLPAVQQAVLVALTGWGAEDDRARSREAGFDHHLTKPAEIAAVERLLAGLETAMVAASTTSA